MTLLGKYELHEQLGKGGFGTVYRATDTVLDVERAVKVLHPLLVADTAFVSRFRQEAQLAAKLEHPNLVPVYDFGEFEGRFFLAMKYMSGGSLADLLKKEGKLEEETAIRIFSQAAEGLDYAHSKSIVHRDLKPSNILFDQDGNVRISDLGFAKSMDGGSRSSMSTSGMMVGTPSYMAPEIWKGKPASPASDIYSMGCILYEMLAGKVLFAGDSPADIMTRHVLEGPEYKGLVSHEQERVLSTALGKDAGERFHSVSQFVDSLRLSAHNDKPPDNVVLAPHHVLERQTEDAALEQKKAEPLEEPEIRTARIDTKKEEPPISDIKQFSEPFLYRDAFGRIRIGQNSMGLSLLLILIGWITGFFTWYLGRYLLHFVVPHSIDSLLPELFGGGIIGLFTWLSLRNTFHFSKRQLIVSLLFSSVGFFLISDSIWFLHISVFTYLECTAAGIIFFGLFILLFRKHKSLSKKQVMSLCFFWGGSFAIIPFVSFVLQDELEVICFLRFCGTILQDQIITCIILFIGLIVTYDSYGIKKIKPNGIDQFPVFSKTE